MYPSSLMDGHIINSNNAETVDEDDYETISSLPYLC